MNDIKKITAYIDDVEFSKTVTGKQKLNIKIGDLYYSVWQFKNDGTETKAWQQAKEIGSENLIGKKFNISYKEYQTEDKMYPYRTIVGFYSADAIPETSVDAQNNLLIRIKNLELRVSVLEGKISHREQVIEEPEANQAPEVENRVNNLQKNKQQWDGTVENIPF